MPPRLLVACECSGVVRREFRARGVEAWSCDMQPAEDGSPYHWRGDVLELIARTQNDPEYWPPFDAMICHPPCQFLSVSGLHWNKRRPKRAVQTEAAVEFALALWNAPIAQVALENPVGLLSSRIRKPDCIVQPYEFSDDASKATCLWVRGLPPLRKNPADRLPGRLVKLPSGKTVERWSNQTDSGQNKLPPSPTRAQERARTYPGIARAMAEQWAPLIGKPKR